MHRDIGAHPLDAHDGLEQGDDLHRHVALVLLLAFDVRAGHRAVVRADGAAGKGPAGAVDDDHLLGTQALDARGHQIGDGGRCLRRKGTRALQREHDGGLGGLLACAEEALLLHRDVHAGRLHLG